MPQICLYFQVHQPYRLTRYRVFDIGTHAAYFDDAHNQRIAERVSAKCYIPANRLLTELISRSDGAFKVAMSTSGVLLEQLASMVPDALETFRELVATGGVEMLGETYYHSLSGLVSVDEFGVQVDRHSALIEDTFGQRPRVFRNTELIFSDAIAPAVQARGFTAALIEGAPHILGWREPSYVYESTAAPGLRLLTRHFQLSDDVAFRFSARNWSAWPLRADTFAEWLASSSGHCINLFMDYETFGEHQWSETGIFEFLRHLPAECCARGLTFVHPSTLAQRAPIDRLTITRPTSWADQERDISAWLGNGLQRAAHERLYALRPLIMQTADTALYRQWQRLTTSDHFYYMATKDHSDGEVHAYFSAYGSPYDAFVRFMNVTQDLEQKARATLAASPAPSAALAPSLIAPGAGSSPTVVR